MPIYKEWSPNTHSLAGIWHIEEDEPFFLRSESVREAARIEHIKHARRRIEHLAGRYLLQHLKEDFPLQHIVPDVHDKPRLPENQYFFSISHSYPYVAVVISDQEECGIDLQVWKARIHEIAYMFLSEQEQALCRDDGRLITLAWTMKEAAYKWYGRRGASFINDLPIRSLPEGSGESGALSNLPLTAAMECFGIRVTPQTALFKDFAMTLLVRERL